MTDLNRPRRGSMAFRPRKRAASQNGSVFWQSSGVKRILGFSGYKVGMTHISYIDHTESPTKGQEVVSGATVIEVPPVYVYGYRLYNGNSVGDVLVADDKVLKQIGVRKPKVQGNQPSAVSNGPTADGRMPNAEIKDIRLLVFAQPAKTTIGKKHIERMELGIGGKDSNEKLEYAKSLLGKELKASDVFKQGEFVDVVAITKGKGWQGAVKRFGVAVQRRKSTGKRRHVGTLGQWHPAYVLYTVPQAGQMGYHQRTELNKQIMRIGSDIDKVNPSGGFPNYGFVKNDYVLLKGSIPGPAKRLIKLRLAVRTSAVQKEPSVMYIARP
ncbi:50S ribosomal protein L3 [Candidatus Micrarchaeota archaeon]|nr:50S ribosomal protein L3 [Candidatus Micrarchaeota archaeon]